METPSPYQNIPELASAESLFSLKGKTGAIIGGAGKISQASAKALALAGARLVLGDSNEELAKSIARSLPPNGECPHLGLALDVGSESSVSDFFRHLENEFERLDFLVYSVMSKPPGYYRPFENYSKSTWDQVLTGNLTGAFLCSQKAAALISRNEQGGSIVLTSSIYGLVGPDQRIYRDCSPAGNIYGQQDPLNAPGAYSAAKAGVIGLSRYLATLLGERKIRVNSFIPGGVYDGQEESFHLEYVKRTPLGRMAVWSDYAGPLLFLVSDSSRYMTGTNLVVDGGWSAW